MKNQITGTTSACFEPSIDYVVCKVPRFNFDKFPGADEALSTQMKAVGEVMSIGRNFPEALNKAWQSMEIGRSGLGADGYEEINRKEVSERLMKPYWDRSLQVRNAFKLGASVEEIADITKIDPWFLQQIKYMVSLENRTEGQSLEEISSEDFYELKQAGFSDAQIAWLTSKSGVKVTDDDVRARRLALGLKPSFKVVDTCAAEFPAQTPYYYSAYEGENESIVTDRKKVVILGSGPNRIGQGIEFDYSCVHAVLATKEMGYEAIMVNCNPETVSTDFDFADKLYFEPVYWERVLDIIDHEQPEGVIIQVGGQTALKLGKRLVKAGIKIFGTDFANIDLAEDRGLFSDLLIKNDIPFPAYGTATEVHGALEIADRIGYPVLIRPSYVLGGQGMRIAVKQEELERYVDRILKTHPENAFLIDKYLEHAIEVDVDSVFDGDELHFPRHDAAYRTGRSTLWRLNRGNSPYSLSKEVQDTIRAYQTKIAKALNVIGFLNVQYAVKDDKVYVIEANPRTTRTVPFLAKANEVPEAKIGVKVMLGAKLKEFDTESKLKCWAIKEPVFPFDKFPGVKKELGPEMKSTGESIYFAEDFNDEHFRKPFEFKKFVFE